MGKSRRMANKFGKGLLGVGAALSLNSAQALPIDWQGAFGVDTTYMTNFLGNEEVNSDKSTADWQSYVFRLNPTIIINDAVSFKGELSSGYGRGGIVGQNTANTKAGITGALYGQTFDDGENDINISQAYAELYTETATYLVGRHTTSWGLGVVMDDGKDVWDRYKTIRDGITAKIKLGNFYVEPFYAKIAKGAELTGSANINEFGLSFLYDNPDNDLAMGIFYSLRKGDAGLGLNLSGYDPATGTIDPSQTIGDASINLIDIYFRKSFGDFKLALEVPIYSGDISQLYSNTSGESKFKGTAIILETSYEIDSNWNAGINAGYVTGDDASDQSSYDAMFLNPNYQIANILFRYNPAGIKDSEKFSPYDSYVNNTTYVKAFGTFENDYWKVDTGIIWANAVETASMQDSNYGLEFDVNSTYKWNNELSLGLDLGYLLTGDFYKFNSAAGDNSFKAENVFFVQAKLSLLF